MKLIAGNAHLGLAEAIANHLDVKLVDCVVKKFSNTEIDVRITDSIRNEDIFILQTGSFDEENSVNDFVMETLLLIDACRRSNVKSITLVMPCYPYARQDKKDNPRVPISAKLLANMYQNAGVDRLISVDLHASQIQGFFDFAFDNLYAIGLLTDYLVHNVFVGMTDEERLDKYILVSPDNGGTKRIMAYSQRLKVNNVIMHKQRDYSTSSKVDKVILIGDYNLKGKTAIIIDDMCDTMNTMIRASKALVENGVNEVIIVATHGIFSGNAIERINESEFIGRVIITNTLPQDRIQEKCDKLVVVDISILIGTVINNIVHGYSISQLFI